jgi:succinyl-CoA:acetate CoA-transferase
MSVSEPATRVFDPKLESKIMSAEEVAGLIRSGDQIGMSGFTGSGYPKALPNPIGGGEHCRDGHPIL